MVRSSSVDPDMIKKCIKCLINRPDLKVPAAMKLTNFSVEEVANLSLCRLIQQSLPGKTLEGLKGHALLFLRPQPGCDERLGNCAINVEGTLVVESGSRTCAIAVTPSPLLPRPPPAVTPQSGPSSSDVSTALAAVMMATLTIAVNKQVYYAKKKLCLLDFEPDAAATAIFNATTIAATPDTTAVATADSVAAVAAITGGLSIITNLAAAADPWSLITNDTERTPVARKMA